MNIKGLARVPLCSVRGTNSQSPNRFYEFVYLQVFNVTYRFAHLRLFDDIKFLLSEVFVIFRKQKRAAVYRRASLVSDFKLTQENYDLLYSTHK